MFHYQGSRTDKHVREHEVYAIGYPGDFTSTQRSLAKQSRQAGATGFDVVLFKLENYWDAFIDTMARWERRAIEIYRKSSTKQRAGNISIASVLLISVIITIVMLASRPETKAAQVASAEQVKAEKAQSASAAVQKEIVAEERKQAAAAEKKVQGVKQSSRVRTLAETTGAPAVVSFVVQPWGEIYLDGRMQGVSPPLLELQVVAGKHEIKIRNTTLPTYTQGIKVKSGEKIKIKHTFAH